MATLFLLADEPEKAVEYLEQRLQSNGFATAAQIAMDATWDPLREREDFQALMREYE